MLDAAILKGPNVSNLGVTGAAVVVRVPAGVRHERNPTQGPKHAGQREDGQPRPHIRCRPNARPDVAVAALRANGNNGGGATDKDDLGGGSGGGAGGVAVLQRLFLIHKEWRRCLGGLVGGHDGFVVVGSRWLWRRTRSRRGVGRNGDRHGQSLVGLHIDVERIATGLRALFLVAKPPHCMACLLDVDDYSPYETEGERR